MGAFADLRSAVEAALAAACAATPEWSVHALPVDALTPPAYLIGWSDPWLIGRSTSCTYLAQIEVLCVAARLDPDPGLEVLELMVEAAVLELDRARLAPLSLGGPRAFALGGLNYQAAPLTITYNLNLAGGP